MPTERHDKEEVEELKKEIESLRADVAAVNDSLQRFLAQTTSAAPEVTGDEVAEAAVDSEWQELQRRLEEARANSEEVAAELRKQVEANPLLSLGVALGAGYLLARITGIFK